MKRAIISGEVLGTFLLVFFGCGAVAGSVIFDSFGDLFAIAIIWGLGLMIAILLAAPLSGAHLNPAISLAFCCAGELDKKHLPLYLAGQFLGAFLAATVLYLLIHEPLASYENRIGIQRSEQGSEQTARIFGEFHSPSISTQTAALAEFLGTGLLAFVIFLLTDKRRPPFPPWFLSLAIGMTLTVLISLFAPFSMAGFNPARDLAPRFFSSLAGWGRLPFQVNGASWWLVYLLAPCLGAIGGGLLAKHPPTPR
ncbi:MIP/aquaporin family protein [Roseibacillus ishigakijimensis]|uniref:Aquaporin n=1 Tax=Roseibacillus ishigakijimensis TaxID=454146 RepID=A0A934VN82_9BACT|nr:aquaporin [Roseibacillus ishigakijimensis]MBK1834841.1 aquaporin [Roseibacillus ishigakijimensis]